MAIALSAATNRVKRELAGGVEAAMLTRMQSRALLVNLLCSFLPGQLAGRLPLTRASDRFGQQLFIARDDGDAFASARGRDIEQFSFHGVGRDHHCIDRFALAAMCGYRVAVIELPIVGRQQAAVFQLNATLPIHTRHRDGLAIGGAKAGLAAIREQEQLVVRRNPDRAPFVHLEALRLPGRHGSRVAGNE